LKNTSNKTLHRTGKPVGEVGRYRYKGRRCYLKKKCIYQIEPSEKSTQKR